MISTLYRFATVEKRKGRATLGKNKPLRIGIIDLGTNSVRFDVHAIASDRKVRLLHREKLMVRLGENVFLAGKLDAKAIRRTLQAFLSFKHTAQELKADRIVAFATSALREASDSAEFIRQIKSATGIEIRVITGDEEARLIAAGVLSHYRKQNGTFALVDIGGGSTEISIIRDGKRIHGTSFPIGVARLQQVFLKTTPPQRPEKGEPSPIELLNEHVEKELLSRMADENWPSVDRILGSSGTIRAIGRTLKLESGEKAILRGDLKRLGKRLSKMTSEQIAEIPGMEPKRVDLILAGTLLLEGCMDALDCKRVDPTPYSLRDGILAEEIAKINSQKATSPDSNLTVLYEIARRFGCQERQLRPLVASGEAIFDRLRSLHKLTPNWKSLLSAAIIFRDVGRAISPAQHELHSQYIVIHSEIPSTEDWETEFVGQLVRLHENTKPAPDELPYGEEKEKELRDAFMKLLAMLQIVDALDSAHPRKIGPEHISCRQGDVFLRLTHGHWVDLAVLRIQVRKKLFELVFSTELRVVTE